MWQEKSSQKTSRKHLDFLNTLQRTLAWFDFRYLVAFATTNNRKVSRNVCIIDIQKCKLDKLLTDYLATGIDPDNSILIIPILHLRELKRKCCPVVYALCRPNMDTFLRDNALFACIGTGCLWIHVWHK